MLEAVKNYLGGLLAILWIQASSKTIKSKLSDNGARSVSLHKIDYRPKNGSKFDFFLPILKIFGDHLDGPYLPPGATRGVNTVEWAQKNPKF